MLAMKVLDLVEESVRINRSMNDGAFFIVARFARKPTLRKRVNSFEDVIRTLQGIVDFFDDVLMSFSFERTK